MTKNILVTGSTAGIGLQTAKELAAAGAHVIVHGRTEAKAREAAAQIEGAAAWACDFESLAEIRAAAPLLPGRVDVLINNAGILAQRRALTADGHELTFQVNHLAPFLLTSLVLARIPDGGRVVNVSSQVHSGAELDFDDLEHAQGWSGYGAYARSKLANLLFTRELARREPRLRVNALHPGVIDTRLLRAGFSGMGGASLEQGAETPVYLALSDEVAEVTGKYFVRRREVRPSPQALDDAAAQRLWDVSERLVAERR